MKKLTLLLIAAVGLLSGCVAYDTSYRDNDGHRGDRDHHRQQDRDRDGVPDRVDRDRDGDGVRNRQDERPNDARRY